MGATAYLTREIATVDTCTAIRLVLLFYSNDYRLFLIFPTGHSG
jgi:hypothetical protein